MSHKEKTAKAPPPVIQKDLLDYLERCFPNRVPSIDTPARKVWAAVGQQDVIANLRALFTRQNKPLE